MTDLMARLQNALAGRYTIERELGRGGMATVYLARDVKHERAVALKVLRPELAAALGPERFLQEIKIAANLHHPHILPLYDSGEAGGFLYSVMPYVEGESLRERLTREKQLAIDDALQVAREVADALSYAHGHGVIHRDIKPENILLESGHAVVADFGIARAVDAAGGERLTETGIAVGTPAYMSPEQVAGSRELDGRSDLYSLGCVLHEMLAGQPPFTGPTAESLTHQHLTAEPPRVTSIRPSVPGWVVAALERSLAKTPADRFNPVAQFGEAITPRASVATGDVRLVPTPAHRSWLIPGVAGLALLVVAAVLLVRSMAPGPITITLSGRQQVTRAVGGEWEPVISPDGSEVVYTAGSQYDYHVFVQDLGGGEPFALTADRRGVQRWPRWMSDGRKIVFLEFVPGLGSWSHVISRRGGPSRRVGDRGGIWDVHDDRMVYRRNDSLLVRPIDASEETLIAVGTTRMHSMTYSPDGTAVAWVRGNPHWVLPQSLGNVAPSSIWLVALGGGEPVRVTDDTTLNVSPAWMPDGRHLLFVSDRDGPRDIYAVRVDASGPPAEEPVRVTIGLDPHSISLSADGATLAYSAFTNRQNVWEIGIPEGGSVSISEATPVTQGNQIVETHGISRDGHWLAFDSNHEGTQDVYLMPADGGDVRRVTTHVGNDLHPDFSPDGSEIVFYSQRHGTRDVFLISFDGRGEVQVTSGPSEDFHPSFSPDGMQIAFSRDDAVYVMSRDSVGGQWTEPEVLTTVDGAFYSRWSPDGSRIVFQVVNTAQIWTVALKGEERLLFDGRAGGVGAVYWPDWSTDGRWVYFVGIDSASSMGFYAIPSGGGSPRKVVHFDDPTKFGSYALAPTVGDGKVYFTLVEYESDIYVMDLEW